MRDGREGYPSMSVCVFSYINSYGDVKDKNCC